MACDRLRELALLDVDDGLAPDERAELESHVATCAECRAAREGARLVARGVRQLPVPPVPLGFSERTLQRLDRARSVAARPRALVVRLAAAAVLLIGATLFFVQHELATNKSAEKELVATNDLDKNAKAPEDAADERRKDAEPRGGDAASKLEAPALKERSADEQERSRELAKAEGRAPAPGAPAPAPPGAGGQAAKDGGSDADGKPGDAGLERGAAGGKLEQEKAGAPPASSAVDVDAAVRDLALGTPADALRRIGVLAAASDEERRVVERRDVEANSPAAEKKTSAAPAAAPAQDDAKKSLDDAGAALPPPPTLRFVRAHVDATSVGALLPLKGKGGAGDDASRLVFDLTEAESKALEAQLAKAGVRIETLAAADWLAALREAADRARYRADEPVARGEPARTDSAAAPTNTKSAGAPTSGTPRGGAGNGGPTTGGAKRKFGEPKPAPRVRWIVLAGE